MAKNIYNRDGTPFGEEIVLEVLFTDVAGNAKDTDSTPTLRILAANNSVVRTASSTGIRRVGTGRYSFDFEVPDGYSAYAGEWSDIWSGTVDGYQLQATFNFTVSSVGEINAVRTVVEPEIELGDPAWDSLTEYSQQAKANINYLLRLLRSRLRSTAIKPDGSTCNIFKDEDLICFLELSLSELNATPTVTSYLYDHDVVRGLFADILTQGAMLQAWSGQALIEAGREYTISDANVALAPPPVSSTITGMFNAQNSDYRAKLKELKRNIRPHCVGISAGSLFLRSPVLSRLRHRKESQII